MGVSKMRREFLAWRKEAYPLLRSSDYDSHDKWIVWQAACASKNKVEQRADNTGSPTCCCDSCAKFGSCGVTIFKGTILVSCPKYAVVTALRADA